MGAKAQLDFHALISEATPAEAYGRLDVPVLIMLGERSPAPTEWSPTACCDCCPTARSQTIPGAGHMGAITPDSRIR